MIRRLSLYAQSAVWIFLSVWAFAAVANGIGSAWGPWPGFAAVLMATWLAVLVHELGHAIVAVLCGWRVIVFVAGPIGIHLHNRELAFISRARREGLAGYVLAAPLDLRRWTRRRSLLHIAGGPVASVILFALALLASVLQKGGANAGGFSFALALMSLATLFGTLMPSGTGKHSSDGQKIRRLLQMDDDTWLRREAFARLYGLTSHRVRLRELPAWMLDLAQLAAADETIQHQQAIDGMRIGIMLDHPPVPLLEVTLAMDRFEARYGRSNWLDCCKAYCAAVWDETAVDPRAFLPAGQVEEDLRPLALAAEAAVLAREGEIVRSRALVRRMQEKVRSRAFTDRTFADIAGQVVALGERAPRPT